jgi:acetolactate synthase-1/2/3 large subunit
MQGNKMTTKKTSVAQAVVDALREEKVEFVFGLTGTHVLPLFDALADVPQLRHIVVKHESNAAFMAGMYGYLTGRPGVAMVTAGPGAINSLSGVAQAYAASLPMVHISGDVPLNAGNEAYHGVDRRDFLHRMFADVTKWSVRIERAEDIPGVLSRAFALAASGRPGPVHVDIPWDIVGARDIETAPYQPSPVERQSPPEDLIQQVRQALSAARRPMICAGRGVLTHRAETELVALAEAASAPVLCTNYGSEAMDHDHPLFVGTFSEWSGNPFAWELLGDCDFLLAIGLRSDTRMTDMLVKHAPENTILVALDEPHTLRPVPGMAAVVPSDSHLFLSRLLDHADEFRRPALDAASAQSPRTTRIRRIAEHWEAWNRGLALHLAGFEDAKPLHFGVVGQELAGRLDPDAIVAGGVGNHTIWARTTLPSRNRESFVEEASWGTMGSELGGGIAAKLVYPDRQVVVVTGDGSLLMAAADFVTAVEAQANILVVVLNDSRYGIITAIQRREFQRSFGDEIGKIDFVRFAESFGASGIRVESPEELPDAVARALALSAETPVILDVVCNYEYRWPDRDAILAAGREQGASER